MLNKKILLHCFIASLLIGFFVFSADVNLANAESTTGLVSEGCMEEGDCKLNDIMLVFVGYSEKILGLIGSLALLFFIYGGFMFLISGGSSERVTKAKQIILGAVIGLAVVFTRYMIITFVAQALGIETSILQSDWFNK
jgi:hypothetical protein